MARNAAPKVARGLRHLSSILANCLYPERCVLCRAPATNALCPDCRVDLPFIERGCKRCALPLSGTGNGLECGACQRRAPAFDRAAIPLLYAPPADVLITRFKFHGKLPLAATLATLIAEHVQSDPRPDVIVPVPLHPIRVRERGFNQSLELARVLSRQLAVPLSKRALTRTRHTQPQTNLDLRRRRRNLVGAFRAVAQDLPTHVALVDDVMTTGATAEAAATELKRAGAISVSVWAIARTK